jgi:hypothetical protein
MPETIIADTSVLIALEKINLLHILCNLYKEIILPEGVIAEFGNVNIELDIPCSLLQGLPLSFSGLTRESSYFVSGFPDQVGE